MIFWLMAQIYNTRIVSLMTVRPRIDGQRASKPHCQTTSQQGSESDLIMSAVALNVCKKLSRSVSTLTLTTYPHSKPQTHKTP